MISCPICDEEKKVSYRCEYKYEIFEDKQYFDHLDIYKCDNCDFSFAHPMPKSKNLDFFYENVYRQVNRPPYWVTESDEDIEKRQKLVAKKYKFKIQDHSLVLYGEFEDE